MYTRNMRIDVITFTHAVVASGKEAGIARAHIGTVRVVAGTVTTDFALVALALVNVWAQHGENRH